MENHIKNFSEEIKNKIDKISSEEIIKAAKCLQLAYENNARIYLIGNGGSSAIASHFANDLNKTILGHKGEKKIKRFQAISLCDNIPVITAWANDVSYEKIFSEQLKNFAKSGDVLIAISSSGNSPNIIEAAKKAKEFSLPVIGFMGFDGGKLLELSDAKIYVPSSEYAIVESIHDTVCHLIISYFEKILF